MNTPKPRQNQGTAIGFAILGLAVVFFVWAAVAGVDPGRLLRNLLLIPFALGAAIALLMVVWAIVVNLLGRLLGKGRVDAPSLGTGTRRPTPGAPPSLGRGRRWRDAPDQGRGAV